jgi:hypothetical protein
MTRRAPIVVLNRLPMVRSRISLLLLRRLLAVPFNHNPVPYMQVIGPVHRIRLFIFTTVAREAPSVCLAVVDSLRLLPLNTPSVDHHAATSSYPPTEARLVLEGHVVWWCREAYPCASPWIGLWLLVQWRNCHCISAFFVGHGSWRRGKLTLRKDGTEVALRSRWFQRWCDGPPCCIDPAHIPLLVLNQVVFNKAVNGLAALGLLLLEVDKIAIYKTTIWTRVLGLHARQGLAHGPKRTLDGDDVPSE